MNKCGDAGLYEFVKYQNGDKLPVAYFPVNKTIIEKKLNIMNFKKPDIDTIWTWVITIAMVFYLFIMATFVS